MPDAMAREFQITSKVKRANEHIADLDREIRKFLDTNPYKVGAKRDPESRKLIYYIGSVEPTPASLSLIAGDAVQNLMSALDHLAYQLVLADTGDNPPNPNWVYFPISDDAAKYEAKKRGKMEGVRQDTIDAIDAIKPYKGGNDLLWSLYRLNNIEKHRLLITVGSMFQSVNLGAYMHPMIEQMVRKSQPDATVPVMDFFVKPVDKLFPLKVGDELLVGAPNEVVNEKMQFRFNVALSEPQIIEAESLLETVRQMANLVDGIISGLSPRLK